MDFLARIAKALTGIITTVASLPIVETIVSNVPLTWTFEHAIAGVLVGATVYAIPNKETAP